ncbi:MAG: hypothetical protein ACPHL6_13890, partial [Rubripirellula sp.]
VMSGSTRPSKGWERLFQSALARSWTRKEYTSQVLSLLTGEFLVIDPSEPFNPSAPPEWKAAIAGLNTHASLPPRTDQSVPVQKLNEIQDCFVKPPIRHQLTSKVIKENYSNAVKRCNQVIKDYPKASDLWMVRNRLIVALLGLWKIDGKREHFDLAIKEADSAIQAGYPQGTDIVARFCQVRETLRRPDTDPSQVIRDFVKSSTGKSATISTNALASLLALEIGDRKLHEQYRRKSLDQYAEVPILWNASAILLDRYHRYWLYHPPFTAGWTYGRRQGHFLATGVPEDANRKIDLELNTLEGKTIKIPEYSSGKWTIIEFQTDAQVLV